MTRRDDLMQFFGHFHGGVITALADQAAGIAVTSGLPKGKIGVTVEIKVNFLEPADGVELDRPRQNPEDVGLDRRRHRRGLHAKNEKSEPLCAFCTATMRAMDLPGECPAVGVNR